MPRARATAGRHFTTCKSRALSWVWDWTGVAAPIAGLGTITIDGELLAWARWTPAGLAAGRDLVDGVLGKPLGTLSQAPVLP